MTELLVALDCPNPLDLYSDLQNNFVGLGYKINASHLFNHRLIDELSEHDLVLMDLKCYDIASSVYAIAKEAFSFAELLTVYADENMLKSAMLAKDRDTQKVFAIGRLTDGTGMGIMNNDISDGYVCTPSQIIWLGSKNKLYLCPGIALDGENKNAHSLVYTPKQAKEAGANYIVMGSSIYNSKDPVETVRRVLEELSE